MNSDTFLRALNFQQSGDLAQAEKYYQRVLEAEPGHVDTLVNYGVLLHQQQRSEESIQLFDRALMVAPQRHDALINRGIALRSLSRYAQAIELFKAFVMANPLKEEGYIQLATTFLQFGHLDATYTTVTVAKETFPTSERVNQLFISAIEFFFNSGNQFHQNSQYVEASRCFQYACDLNPNIAAIHLNLGEVNRQLANYASAIQSFQRAIQLSPQLAMAHYNLAKSYKEIGQYSAAIVAYAKAIELEPEMVDAMYNLANLLADLGKLEDARDLYRKAITMGTQNCGVFNNYVNTLLLLDALDDAEKVIQEGLKIDEGHLGLLASYGRLLEKKGCYDECRLVLQRALDINAGEYKIHFTLAALAFNCGDFEEGLAELEFRDNKRLTELSPPDWHAETINLLVTGEQGLGDQLRYAWFLAHLAQEPAIKATVVCDVRLIKLFQRSFPAIEFLSKAQWREQIKMQDFYSAEIPLASLAKKYAVPMAQRFQTYCEAKKSQQISSVKAHLKHDRERTNYWRALFDSQGNNKPSNDRPLKIGFCWRGPVSLLGHFLRYPPLESFQLLFKDKNIKLINLQYQSTMEESQLLESWLSTARVIHLPTIDLKDDVDELAAIISACDLVISPSTTMFEFAGSLGVKTWVYKTTTEVDWTFTPAYFYGIHQTVSIYSKKGDESWDVVVRSMAAELDLLNKRVGCSGGGE